MPTKSRIETAGFDIYMPESGEVKPGEVKPVGLGFAAEIPPGNVGLIFPRSGVGAKYGVELFNTCGVIDCDYRGEWIAALHLKDSQYPYRWDVGDRLLQFLVIPIAAVSLTLVNELNDTTRGKGGFGSSGR